MGILGNYEDLYRRILSDAMQFDYCIKGYLLLLLRVPLGIFCASRDIPVGGYFPMGGAYKTGIFLGGLKLCKESIT